MKRTEKHAGRLVAELRRIIGKSQSQFAVMLGVSKDTIISVENARNDLSRNLAKRIAIATGADLIQSKLESPFSRAPYTRADFDRWRKKYSQSTEAQALQQFKEMQTWLKVIFLAAAKSGRAGNRDRLPALSLSLAEWLDQAREQFQLKDEIEDVLNDETRTLVTTAHHIPTLLEDPGRAKNDLAEHDIDFNKIKAELKKHLPHGKLFIQDEYRDAWTPGTGFFPVLVDHRKLIPQSRYWIKEFKPNLAAFQESGTSHPELSDYLRDITEGKIPLPEFKTGGKS